MRLATIFLALVCAPVLVAQTQAELLQQLQSKGGQSKASQSQASTAELARRKLCLQKSLSKDTAASLVELLKAKPGLAWAAATILQKHNLAEAERRALFKTKVPRLQLLVIDLQDRATLTQGLATEPGDAETLSEIDRQAERDEVAQACLSQLENRGWLADELILETLRGKNPELRAMACRILVLERSPFPLKIAEALLDHVPARNLLLEALAERPRMGAGPWLMRLLDDKKKLAPIERMMALAALPEAFMNRRMGTEILDAATQSNASLSFRAQLAAARLTPELADELVAEVPRLLKQGRPTHGLTPCFARITPKGEARFLAAAESVSSTAAGAIAHWLASRKSRALDARMLAALADNEPLPAHLLRLVSPYLKTKDQVQRVVGFLADKNPERRVQAFDVLIEAGVYDEAMLDYALEDNVGRRARRLLNLGLEVLPSAALESILSNAAPMARSRACYLLAQKPLSKKFEETILEIATGSLLPQERLAAAQAILIAGSEAAGVQVWEKLTVKERRQYAVEWLIHKPRLWSHERLLAELELTREHVKEPQFKEELTPYYHKLLLALSRLGDRSAQDELLQKIAQLPPNMLERSKGSLLKKLTPKHVAGLRELLLAGDKQLDEEQRLELLEWLQQHGATKNLQSLLEQMWQKETSHEVKMMALVGLLKGENAAALLQKLRDRLRQPLDEESEEMAFEVVGSLSLPLSDDALTLLAELMLVAPLANPAREVRLSLETDWTGSRGEYPMMLPISNLLRLDDKVRPQKQFEKVIAQQVAGHMELVNRRRLGLFMSLLTNREQIYRNLAPTLARLLLESPDRAQAFVGPAYMALAEAAETAGEFEDAARLYRAANRYLLRWPMPRFMERSFIGSFDPIDGLQPFAALAARPFLCDGRVHLAAGKKQAAAKALHRALDLAYGDWETTAEVRAAIEETK